MNQKYPYCASGLKRQNWTRFDECVPGLWARGIWGFMDIRRKAWKLKKRVMYIPDTCRIGQSPKVRRRMKNRSSREKSLEVTIYVEFSSSDLPMTILVLNPHWFFDLHHKVLLPETPNKVGTFLDRTVRDLGSGHIEPYSGSISVQEAVDGWSSLCHSSKSNTLTDK